MSPPLINAEACRNCKHSKPTPSGQGLQCYALPPTAMIVGANAQGPMFSGVFPPVEPGWRCGLYARKLAIVADDMAGAKTDFGGLAAKA